MQINNFLLLNKLKNAESAQLWVYACAGFYPADMHSLPVFILHMERYQ